MTPPHTSTPLPATLAALLLLTLAGPAGQSQQETVPAASQHSITLPALPGTPESGAQAPSTPESSPAPAPSEPGTLPEPSPTPAPSTPAPSAPVPSNPVPSNPAPNTQSPGTLSAPAASPDVSPLSAAQVAGMNAVLSRAKGFRTGVLVTDAASGQTLYARRQDELFTPASNMKLLSLGTALYTLEPDAWLSTSVTRPAGQPGAKQAAHVAHLTLVGSGDPSLGDPALGDRGEHSLTGLARQVYASGVRRVDTLHLDARLIGAAPGQGEAGWSVPVVERPVSGLTLNDPSAGEGDTLTTTPDTRAALTRLGREFRAELIRAGVQVGSGLVLVSGPVSQQAGSTPEEGVATTRSAPLSALVRYALKRSDNVWAEQLYARLGVNMDTPVWRPASRSYAKAQEFALLARAGVAPGGIVIADGSGLSRRDRLTPHALNLLLRYVYLHPLLADPGEGDLTPQDAFLQRKNLLIEALPRAGTGTASKADALLGGTLATRLKGLDVRAKTGTLPGVSALSGYLKTDSGRVLVFSVMMDGYGGPGEQLRQVQDALLRALAADQKTPAEAPTRPGR